MTRQPVAAFGEQVAQRLIDRSHRPMKVNRTEKLGAYAQKTHQRFKGGTALMSAQILDGITESLQLVGRQVDAADRGVEDPLPVRRVVVLVRRVAGLERPQPLAHRDAPARQVFVHHAELDDLSRGGVRHEQPAPVRQIANLIAGWVDRLGPVDAMVWKPIKPGQYAGRWESYKSEIAAYELDKLLGLDMVPPAVERQIKGDIGAAVMWVEGVKGWDPSVALAPPNPLEWTRQVVRMKMPP